MIISYSVSNFCSFNEGSQISFEKTGGRQHTGNIIDNKYLSGAVIYGANASGKTSFLRSINILKKFLLINDLTSYDLQKHQFKFCKNDITKFCIEFIWNKKHYVYSIEVRPNAFVSEKYELYDSKKSKKLIFSRNGFNVTKGEILSGAWFKDKNSVSDKLSYVKMLTSMGLDNVNGKGAKHINNLISFFKHILFVSDNPKIRGTSLLKGIKAMPNFRSFLNQLLKESDFGIDCIDFKILSSDFTEQLLASKPQDMPLPSEGEGLFYAPNSDDYYFFSLENGKIVGRKLQVKVDGVLFDFDQLSAGTRKIINMSIQLYLYKYDDEDTFLVMDELDCSLHSFVAKRVLQSLLNKDSDSNKSQILVSLHDTSLMDIQDIWRDDQIWFVKKDYDHSSKLYSLANFDLRPDKKVSKDYLNGKYGAIPFLGADLFGVNFMKGEM